MLFFIMLCNRLKISEYLLVYWLTDFNSWVHLEIIIIFLLKRYALVIKKLTNKYKWKLAILQLKGIIDIKSKGHLHLQIF